MLHRSTSLIAKTEVCPVWAISPSVGRPAIERLTGHGSRSRFWRAHRTRVAPGRYPGRPGCWCARYWSAPGRDRRQAGGSRSPRPQRPTGNFGRGHGSGTVRHRGVRESRVIPVLIRLGMPEAAVTSAHTLTLIGEIMLELQREGIGKVRAAGNTKVAASAWTLRTSSN